MINGKQGTYAIDSSSAKQIILKKYGNTEIYNVLQKEDLLKIMENIISSRFFLSKYIEVPELYKIEFDENHNCIVIEEEYIGKSLFDIYKGVYPDEIMLKISQLINNIFGDQKKIDGLVEYSLDISPKNFCLDNENNIYLVDFMLPLVNTQENSYIAKLPYDFTLRKQKYYTYNSVLNQFLKKFSFDYYTKETSS